MSVNLENQLLQQALTSLAEAGLGNESIAETYILGYQSGWKAAISFAIRVETECNQADLMPEEAEP